MNTGSSKSLAPLPDWEPPTRIELFRNEWCSDHVGHSGPSAVIVHSGKSLSHDNLLEKVYNVIKQPAYLCRSSMTSNAKTLMHAGIDTVRKLCLHVFV